MELDEIQADEHSRHWWRKSGIRNIGGVAPTDAEVRPVTTDAWLP